VNNAAMKIEENGFSVHYSEFDITVVRTGKLWMLNKHVLKLQGERVKEIVAGYKKLSEKNRFGITMWGLSDSDSWLTEKHGNDKPLLFNSRMEPKPAYCGFVEALRE
jgi:endo-1,4-beta-xylanase